MITDEASGDLKELSQQWEDMFADHEHAKEIIRMKALVEAVG